MPPQMLPAQSLPPGPPATSPGPPLASARPMVVRRPVSRPFWRCPPPWQVAQSQLPVLARGPATACSGRSTAKCERASTGCPAAVDHRSDRWTRPFGHPSRQRRRCHRARCRCRCCHRRSSPTLSKIARGDAKAAAVFPRVRPDQARAEAEICAKDAAHARSCDLVRASSCRLVLRSPARRGQTRPARSWPLAQPSLERPLVTAGRPPSVLRRGTQSILRRRGRRRGRWWGRAVGTGVVRAAVWTVPVGAPAAVAPAAAVPASVDGGE